MTNLSPWEKALAAGLMMTVPFSGLACNKAESNDPIKLEIPEDEMVDSYLEIKRKSELNKPKTLKEKILDDNLVTKKGEKVLDSLTDAELYIARIVLSRHAFQGRELDISLIDVTSVIGQIHESENSEAKSLNGISVFKLSEDSNAEQMEKYLDAAEALADKLNSIKISNNYDEYKANTIDALSKKVY